MAEYVLGQDEDQTKVAQELLANADHPDHVVWRPRSGVPHGGVYEVPDELADRLAEHRRALRDAEAARIEDAQAAADERDAHEDVADGVLTPAEAGFAANLAPDPGAFPPDDEVKEDGEPPAEPPADETPADPADETPADTATARKKARRNTAKEGAADTPAPEETK